MKMLYSKTVKQKVRACGGCNLGGPCEGECTCKGRTVPTETLDHLVTRHVAERLLISDRLEALLQSVVDRRAKADAEVQVRIDELSRERTTAEAKLRWLY